MVQIDYQQARLSRDARFDGVFFTAVKTTGIFCRPVCPATPPKEENVEYFETASEALVSGYRPCLRCRPESAPFSPAWFGTATTVKRALNIIHNEGFHDLNLTTLAERLGITDRYLRKLFEQQLGVSPKAYIQHQQILFAKALLHQTHLPIQDVAFSCGFNNVRRFNDAFKRITTKTPTEIKKLHTADVPIRLQLNYQPPFNWQHWRSFCEYRQINTVETLGQSSYGRTFTWQQPDGQYVKGWFNAVHRPDKHGFNVSIELDNPKYLYQVSQRIREIFDLDANVALIEQSLRSAGLPDHHIISGLRIPKCWDAFEAGIRAIFGQQVSVKAATNLLNTLVEQLGDRKWVALPANHINNDDKPHERIWFPTPEQVAKSDLAFLKIPGARKQTILNLANHFVATKGTGAENDIDQWLALKGIGPWTVEYAKLRGEGHPDIWLDTDLGIKKALDIFPSINVEHAKPWRSYMTFTMWGML
ncbi:Ada metal-binding domain-containing protein [Psychrosphaera sp. 1_MG-2023]|uniref:DNA-3-methyladenine glycosylase 2 family protein n=1 Tax=Psychrosphaera sp. 1_MG-2023 TaxID=3062643 RepID=UPI0026E20831|nr:Ada metal-binding domain-containing protein [Psychrosphaera sp. 1_MG-2023]MDO6718946.1 Ada metal-binding domain-containing protein [Psychrosphaera sp. 1_MG-2023]